MHTPNHLVFPSNKSSRFFRQAWKQCLFGGVKYIARHPISGLPALLHRLNYPILKRSVGKPFRTPEGFTVSTNQELLIWAQMFIEETLYDREFINEFRSVTGVAVVDVGANHGMATAWLGSYNSTARFTCIEPYPMFREIGQRNTRHLSTKWIAAAASNKSCESIPLYLGGLVTCLKPSIIEEKLEVKSVAIDDLNLGPVYLIKIDTDGNSNNVLTGAYRTLISTRHVIIENEDGLDLERHFHKDLWTRRALRSGCDFIFTNKLVPKPVH